MRAAGGPRLRILVVVMGAAVVGSVAAPPVTAAPPLPVLSWMTVVNNTDVMPGASVSKLFNSYNQPSVNGAGLVILRARAKGGDGAGMGGAGGSGGESGMGGGPPHGIYTRDMRAGGPIVKVVDRTSPVPPPNNVGSTFVEFPAFPRIDLASGTFAFRGNSAPVWALSADGRVGTTGVYAGVDGTLVTGASKLGAVDEFGFYAVPDLPGTAFEVFPGAPSVTGSTIVFKGNFTEGALPRTGAFFRDLAAEQYGGDAPVKAIAVSGHTQIPGTRTFFGSISPPSAAYGKAAFAGYDNEESPGLGGIYFAKVEENPKLKEVAGIGTPVPDWGAKSTRDRFTRLGEAVSFDGRFVGFWGAWGDETRTVTRICPTEGNVARQAECMKQSEGTGTSTVEVPVHQGIFVRDIEAGRTYQVAQTDAGLVDLVYWAFSGKVAGSGEDSMEGDDGEPARWRSSTYVAVSGDGRGSFRVAFKGTMANGTEGIYMAAGPGRAPGEYVTIVDTTTPGPVLDAEEAPAGSLVTELGLERDGFRGDWLVISAKMLTPPAMTFMANASEPEGLAGIYATRVLWP